SRLALLPSSRMTLPLTVTWPSSISVSAFRREATPAWARIFCSLSSIRLAFGRCQDGGGGLCGLVRLVHSALQLRQRALALYHRLRRLGGVLRQRGETGNRRHRRFFLDDLARLFRQFLELAQSRQLRQIAQVEQVEKFLRGAVEERPPRLVLLAEDADQLALEERLGDGAAIDAAQVLDLRPRHRLPLGDDCER